MNKPLLIIGRPHSTKTTFLAQFYTRLLTKKSFIRLSKPAENISAIKEASQLLSNGEETKPSPADKNVALQLPLLVNTEEIDLYCPDYGGEQINQIVNTRKIDEKWNKAIKESSNWILFIRPGSLNAEFDLSNKTVDPENLENAKGKKEMKYEISDQSFFIELLQIMLYLKGQNTLIKISSIKLTVALTCWDEIAQEDKIVTPKEKLQQYLPLLLNFIETNWEPGMFNIVGVSPQGFRLNIPENQEKYQNEGNENFGYLIKPDGTQTPDITELISSVI